jgi:hypothetical protein
MPPCAIAICTAIRPHIRANQACPAPTGLPLPGHERDRRQTRPVRILRRGCAARVSCSVSRERSFAEDRSGNVPESCLPPAGAGFLRRSQGLKSRSHQHLARAILLTNCPGLLSTSLTCNLPDVYRQAATRRGDSEVGSGGTRATIACGGKYECVTFPRRQPA